jgi:hypothetical protein
VFRRYEVRRSTSAGVGVNSTLVATISNPNQTSLTDSGGLATSTTYYYRVFVVDTNEIYGASNEGSCTTGPLGYPFADGLTNLDQWVTTGNWGLTTLTAHSGPSSLTDSPGGNYAPNSDSAAQTAVDLSHASWPVLRFWDRYALDSSTRAIVVVNGAPVYEATGTNGDWSQRAIDLSPWAGNANVQISFRLWAGSGTADGWYVDDVSVNEQAPVALGYPFFEDFENGLSRWLPGNWGPNSFQPYSGTNSPHNRLGDLWYNTTGLGWANMLLTAAGEIDLTNAVNPQLVFWWRGTVNPYGSGTFWVQAYTAGQVWQTIWGNDTAGYNGTYDWTRAQVSLTNYLTRKIRLRLYSYGNPDVYLDHLGIGGLEPGAPSLNAPPQIGFVPVLRPTLVVNNAVQAENLPLTYQFEVYSDAGLSHLVAQVPALASGASTTAWTVDINLANHAQYWWRCRASYLTNAGPWMPTATFHVDQGGTPPTAPVLASPTPGAILPDTNSLLTWYPGFDPDPDDYVHAYHVQVAGGAAFASPVIDALLPMSGPLSQSPWVTVSVPVGNFSGVSNLVPGTTYYWRVQSQDGHLNFSDWSAGLYSFVFAHGPQAPPATITAIELGTNHSILLRWTGPTANVYVEAAPSLVPPVAWTTVAGPCAGSSVSVPAVTNSTSGFFRLRSQ